MSRKIALLTAVLALMMVSLANAASLFVRPTTVLLAGRASAATVTVTNSGDTPVTAQLRVFAWDQKDNDDQLTPTDEIVASPPMMTIPAGQTQTIRVVRTAKARPVGEESFRLLVDEVPSAAAQAESTGVKIQLRYSVPVFVMPKPGELAKLATTARISGNELVFEATNSGAIHAQISNVSLSYANGASLVLGEGLVGYVLPDRSRQWRLELPPDAMAHGRPQRVRAIVNGGELLVSL